MQANTKLGEKSHTSNGEGDGDFFVAWDGTGQNGTARVALDITQRQTITFWLDTHKTAWEQQWGTWLAAKLKIHATESSL